MLRMMIVDDEPIIVEGLFELFQQTEHLELELHQAYDGLEALEIAERLRIDILLTDYHMPEMNGLELQGHLMRMWPRCKVIFLTGYNDFDYIQSTLRSDAIDFVLKTEGDEMIMSAVEKAIRFINDELSYDHLIRSARSQLEAALPALRKQCLERLLRGDAFDSEQCQRKFNHLQIPLDAHAPVYLILGRVDEWREVMAEGDKELFMFSIHNIVDEYMAHSYSIAHFIGENNRLVWLLQPREQSNSGQTRILGVLESIQTSCQSNLKLACSFVVSREPIPWEGISQQFDRLSILFEKGLGLGKESLLSDEHVFAAGREQISTRIRRIRLLNKYLSAKDNDKFFELYDTIMSSVEDEQALQTGLPLEVFYELCAIFIAHMNRLELFSELSRKINMSKLLSIREHETWSDIADFFRTLAEHLFQAMAKENEQATHEVISTLQDYIDANLHGDLSLNRLADLVYLTPFYVSRLYKQITKRSLSDYIAEQRIQKAKMLLSEPHMKIQDVGIQIGFDSPAYFTRFFKKITNFTPREYRESLKRI